MRKRYRPAVEGLESLRLLSRLVPGAHAADGVEAPHVSSSSSSIVHELSVSHKKVVQKPAPKPKHKAVAAKPKTTASNTASETSVSSITTTTTTTTTPTATAPAAPTPTPTAGSGTTTGSSASLNAAVLAYAESKMGTQDGDGQCATLAADAEAAAGAKPWYDLGPTGANDDYVWGNLVATVNPSGSTAGIAPGDVIQFHDVTTSQTVTFPNGATETTTTEAMHHTAIVVSVTGNVITLLQQNVGTGPTALDVQLGSIDTTTMLPGSILYVYSPMPA